MRDTTLMWSCIVDERRNLSTDIVLRGGSGFLVLMLPLADDGEEVDGFCCAVAATLLLIARGAASCHEQLSCLGLVPNITPNIRQCYYSNS